MSDNGLGPILASPALEFAAAMVNDVENVRKAAANRLRALTTAPPKGHGLTLHHPEVLSLAELLEELKMAERNAVRNLERAMRAHPLGAWQRSRKCVGEKQLARLLGEIGDPYWNDLHDRPRRLRELYAYSGMHVIDGDTGAQQVRDSQTDAGAGVAPTRARGQKANWNDAARTRLWNMVDPQIKAAGGTDKNGRPCPLGHYRPLYDEAKIKYAEAVHTRECRRCGPKGKPAQPGSPLSQGHQNARAVRIAAKAILRDIWEESRRLHKEGTE
jgi:hypothetical protein